MILGFFSFQIKAQKDSIALTDECDYQLKRLNVETAYWCYDYIRTDSIENDSVYVVCTLGLMRCADLLGWLDSAFMYSQELLDRGYVTEEPWNVQAAYYDSIGDDKKYNKILKKGAKYFPDNVAIATRNLGMYLNTDDYDNIIKFAEIAIKTDPENPYLYYVLGTAYQSIEILPFAEKNYLYALEIDPNYEDAIFNMAVLHYNAGVDNFNKAMALDLDKFYSRNNFLLKCDEEFRIAYPHFEHLLNITLDAEVAMYTQDALKVIYLRLKMYDRFRTMFSEEELQEELNKMHEESINMSE